METYDVDRIVGLILPEIRPPNGPVDTRIVHEARELILVYLLEERWITGNLVTSDGESGFLVMAPRLTAEGERLLHLLLTEPGGAEARSAMQRLLARFNGTHGAAMK